MYEVLMNFLITLPHLCDLLCDVVCPIFDLGCDDGFLRGMWRGRPLVVVGLGEVQGDERNLVDGAVLCEV